MAEGHSKFLSQAAGDYSVFRYCMQNRSLATGTGYVLMHTGVTRITLLFGYMLLLKNVCCLIT